MAIETNRLVLRRFTLEDLGDLYEIMRQPQIGRWLRGIDDGQGFTLEQTKGWLELFEECWDKDGFGPWAVIEKETDSLIGHCGLRIHPEHEWTEIMYGLHPDKWGKGCITEAARASLEFGFRELNKDKIVCYTLPENIGSIRVMQKLGMSYVREFDYNGFLHVLHEINRGEYELLLMKIK